MIFTKLILKSKDGKRVLDFSLKTIIHSPKNSVGKSTLLRLLFWGLGYPIPSTYKLKFDRITVEVYFEVGGQTFHTYRLGDKLEIFKDDKRIFEGIMPMDMSSAQSLIWNIDSPEVLENLLGVIYMEQDKGWTLLNRGKVIGNIRFNVRDLLIGLSNSKDSLVAMLDKLKGLQKLLDNTKRILDLQNITPPAKGITGNIEYKDEDDLIKLDNLNVEKASLENQIRKLRSLQRKAEGLKKYILDLHLMVENPDGSREPILVNEHNLLNFTDNVNLISAQLASLQADLTDVKRKIARINDELSNQVSNLLDSDENEIIDATIATLGKIKIDFKTLAARQAALKKEINKLNNDINEKFNENREIIDETTSWIHKFAKILEVDDITKKNNRYLFTHDIKAISGTEYYKMVVCFKLAYIKVVESHFDMKLPIVWDSPAGREVNQINLRRVIEILNDFFPENQVIFASINTYELKNARYIEIKNKIFESNQLSLALEK
ncbi:hypothetical protein [Lactobacillus delbrueckii]|uniref:hypothetical protein n=1 Tax=Lactobacillus delbrueckii TaxID=1584 RepID=UPI003853B0D7